MDSKQVEVSFYMYFMLPQRFVRWSFLFLFLERKHAFRQQSNGLPSSFPNGHKQYPQKREGQQRDKSTAMATSSPSTSGATAFQTPLNQTGQNGTNFLSGSSNGGGSGLSTGGQVGLALGVVAIALLLGSIGLWATTQTRAKRQQNGSSIGKEAAGRRTVETRTW